MADFIAKDIENGQLFYHEFQQLINRARFLPLDDSIDFECYSYDAPSFYATHVLPNNNEYNNSIARISKYDIHPSLVSPMSPVSGAPSSCNSPVYNIALQGPLKSPAALDINGHTYDFDNGDDFTDFKREDKGYDSGDSEHEQKVLLEQQLQQQQLQQQQQLLSYTSRQSPLSTPFYTSSFQYHQSSYISSQPNSCMHDDHVFQNIKQDLPYDNYQVTASSIFARRQIVGKSKKNKSDSNIKRKPGYSNGNHLWEFILKLLKNPQHCPSLIKWENRADGVFRFVASEDVAKLWGKQKKNSRMTYEKLSRAMRFCREQDYFAAIPKELGYPKKLCFKFGSRSFGWKE